MQLLIDVTLTLVYFFAFLLICAWSWRFWMMYINQKYLNKTNNEYIMLEIRLPREIFKSPFATQIALTSLLQLGGYGTWHDKYFKGNLPIYSSLEIASIEGVIHFYVRIQQKFRPLVESNFYAQYPGIEIVEAEDYTQLIRYTHDNESKVDLWGAGFTLDKKWPWAMKNDKGEDLKIKNEEYKPPADFLPLKTYNDFGLTNPDDEKQVNPLNPLIEMMGTMKKGEHMWFQIILQDEGLYNGKKLPKLYVNKVTHEHLSLSDLSEKFKKQVRTGKWIKSGDKVKDEYGDTVKTSVPSDDVDADGKPKMKTVDKTYKEDKLLPKKETELTMEEKWMVEEANKKFGSPLVVAAIRLIYIADQTKAKFNFHNIQNILSFPRPYAGGPNNLSPSRVVTPYPFDWQNTRGRRVPWRKEELFESYVEREAFYPHITPRDWLDKREDLFFWTSTMKARKTWRMFYEAFFHPFSHPHLDEVSTYNLEEIATLWHLPGASTTTPSLPRIDSAKSVAPVNLPQ